MAKNNSNRKLFALPALPALGKAASAAIPNGPRLKLTRMDRIIEGVAPGYKQQVAQQAIDILTSGRGKPPTMAQNNIINNNKPAAVPDVKVFKDSKVIADTNVSYALSKAPNPKRISLNSGVKVNAYSNDYMVPVESICSPLHMSQQTLQIPTITTHPLYLYFINTICFDIQTRAQANVGFSLDIATKLSATQLLTAFNSAIQALQIYFYYSSILSYESDPRNKNSGMIALRASVDAVTLSDLAQLGRRLEDTPIPPRIVEWVRYMMGTFLSGDSQGSPLLKINFNQLQLGTAAIAPTYPAQALTSLVSDANNTVFTLLRRAIPQWRINTLYDCPPNPTFDRNFLTIFSNLPAAVRLAAVNNYSNNLANTTSDVAYNSFTNRLDGVAYAMAGSFVTSYNGWVPGLTSTFPSTAGQPDSRYSYTKVSGVSAFTPVNGQNFLMNSRQETFNYASGIASYTHLSGTDKCNGVNGNSLLQSAQNTLDYLFNVDAIPVKGMLTHFNGNSKGKI